MIEFSKCRCPNCNSVKKSTVTSSSPVTGTTMFHIQCCRCGYTTEKFFVLAAAEMAWIDSSKRVHHDTPM